MSDYFKTLDTLPKYVYLHESGHPTKGSRRLVWSGTKPPPKVGEVIEIRINGVGAATVDGYASQAGYLGVMATPHNPPNWHPGTSSLTFGAEIKGQRV